MATVTRKPQSQPSEAQAHEAAIEAVIQKGMAHPEMSNGQNMQIYLFACGYGQPLIQRACDQLATFRYNVH